MDSFLPAIHPTPSHLVTPLHLALTILPPSSTLPFASPFSLLAPMAFYAFSAPTSFVLAFCLPALKDSSLDLSPWYFARLITHARYQPVVPAEHKGTRNLNMPPGASEKHTLKIIENHWNMLKHWISECHTLESLELGFRQVLPLSEVIAEAGAVFEQGLSKQSKVALRSGRVQHGSTWFNDILLPHHCRSCCHWVSLKHNALECVAAANGQSEARKHPRSSIFS